MAGLQPSREMITAFGVAQACATSARRRQPRLKFSNERERRCKDGVALTYSILISLQIKIRDAVSAP